MYNAANNASSQLAQAISASDTSLTVLDGSSFPDAPFVVSIEDEIIEVGAKDGNTFSALVRGLEGTAPAAHASGSRVENRFTAGTYTAMRDMLDALASVRIVEMGSNANGTYVRWENGLQVCWLYGEVGSAPLIQPGGIGTFRWVYPVQFSIVPIVFGFPNQPLSIGGGRIAVIGARPDAISTVSADGYRYNTEAESNVDGALSLLAIGRWK